MITLTDTKKVAVAALEEKAREVFLERLRLRRRIFEDALRDVQIEKDIAACVTGAEIFGSDITIPGWPPPFAFVGHPKYSAHQMYLSALDKLVAALPQLASEYGIEKGEIDYPAAAQEPMEMPRIADIIMDRLKDAADSGSKAAAIRNYILQTYNTDIHEKTVGMTLYRLQKEGKVHRDGHTWFLAS